MGTLNRIFHSYQTRCNHGNRSDCCLKMSAPCLFSPVEHMRFTAFFCGAFVGSIHVNENHSSFFSVGKIQT